MKPSSVWGKNFWYPERELFGLALYVYFLIKCGDCGGGLLSPIKKYSSGSRLSRCSIVKVENLQEVLGEIDSNTEGFHHKNVKYFNCEVTLFFIFFAFLGCFLLLICFVYTSITKIGVPLNVINLVKNIFSCGVIHKGNFLTCNKVTLLTAEP